MIPSHDLDFGFTLSEYQALDFEFTLSEWQAQIIILILKCNVQNHSLNGIKHDLPHTF